MGSRLRTWIFRWYVAVITCWISTWKFHFKESWLGTLQIFCYMGRIFGCSFTWHTGWLDDWHWIRIFGCLITGTSTYIPTLLSKYFILSAWNASGNTSWVLVFLSSGLISMFLLPPFRLSQIYLWKVRYVLLPSF